MSQITGFKFVGSHGIRHITGVKRVIFTLDPNKLAEKKQQRFFISNLTHFQPRISLLNQSSPVILNTRLHYDLKYNPKGLDPDSADSADKYPPDTNGFLYYYMSPEKPPIAGELRFRVTSNDVPASFWSGSDLLQLDGRPWSRPLLILLTRYLPLYEKLREDGFVSDDLDADLSTFSTIKYNFTYKSQVLYTINDTFIVDFGIKRGGFTVITEQGAEHIPFTRLFFDSHESIGTPYTGSALVRFERSTLPNHKGTRTVVLRFLKIITPVKCVVPHYDEYIYCPLAKEGELYQRNRGNQLEIWTVNIDTPINPLVRGLQLLWDE